MVHHVIPSDEHISWDHPHKKLIVQNWDWVLAWVTKRTQPRIPDFFLFFCKKRGVVCQELEGTNRLFSRILVITESQIKYLTIIIYKVNIKAFFHISCKLIEIPPVSWREYDGPYIAPSCCYSFLLNLILSTRWKFRELKMNKNVPNTQYTIRYGKYSMPIGNGSQKWSKIQELGREPASLHFNI